MPVQTEQQSPHAIDDEQIWRELGVKSDTVAGGHGGELQDGQPAGTSVEVWGDPPVDVASHDPGVTEMSAVPAETGRPEGRIRRFLQKVHKKLFVDFVEAPAEDGADGAEDVPAAPQSPSAYYYGHEPRWDEPTETETQSPESMHYVKEAPRFLDQAEDETRTNMFSYIVAGREIDDVIDDSIAPEAEVRTMTEHEGLQGLRAFLQELAQDEVHGYIGEGMLENMTFIGGKEYDEATADTAVRWNQYLAENDKNQICIPLGITSDGDRRKSDIHLLEQILGKFSDEELAAAKGRIVTKLDSIDRPPEHTKIVMLDDWMISGTQMKDAYERMRQNERFADYADCVEIQMIVASEFTLKNGFYPYKQQGSDTPAKAIPVKAYYKAHQAYGSALKGDKTHVAGVKSSTDFNYEEPLSNAVIDRNRASEARGEGKPFMMPPLTNIIREYRYAKPTIAFEDDGTIRRVKAGEES